MRDSSPQALWEIALGQLELQITRPNFETWLRNTRGLDLRNGELTVGVPNDFAIEWLRSRMHALINRTVSQLSGQQLTVAFQVLGAQTPAPSPAGYGAGAQPRPATPAQLDPRLTFDSFVALKSNRLAYRAARRAAAGNADCNPVVLYGAPGLGKTHLLHATGRHAASAGVQVSVLTGESFVDQYVKHVRRGDPAAFRAAFDSCEMLLLDDFQFLCSKSGSQEQFFHIFNTLLGTGRPVVLTTDVAPQDLPGLTPRLHSRLLAGLLIEVQPLSPADRRTLIDARAAALPRPLSTDVLGLVAAQPYANVREIIGALNRLAAYADLSDAPLSLEAARSALHPLQPAPAQPSAADILDIVCRYFHLSRDQITGPSRARDITYARHIAMFLLRERCTLPLSKIGSLLGGRDHTTVLSGYQRINQERATLPQTTSALDDLVQLLNSSVA